MINIRDKQHDTCQTISSIETLISITFLSSINYLDLSKCFLMTVFDITIDNFGYLYSIRGASIM